VRTRVILTDIDNWKPAIEARKAYCRDARPVDTIMAVTRFGGSAPDPGQAETAGVT
jgi:hypothetical protein